MCSVPELSSDGRAVDCRGKANINWSLVQFRELGLLSILTANIKITLIFSIKRHLFDSGGSAMTSWWWIKLEEY